VKGSFGPVCLSVSPLRHPPARAAWLGSAVAILVGSSLVGAQPPQRGPGPNSKMLLVVPAFVSADKDLGCTAANDLRNRLDDETDAAKLWIISKEHIDESLKASGFPPCSPISPIDNKQLTQQLRGDYYVDGTATKTATGVRVDARVVMARDVNAAQPLPPAEGPKLNDALRQVSKAVFAALKQMPGEADCVNDARGGKYPEALAAARTAIVAYPPAAIARLCIVNTLVTMKAPPDSILAVTKEILANDPHNHRALEIQAQAYYDQKNYDAAVQAWGGLIAADPSNTVMVEDVVTKIVQSGHPEAALPIVAQAIKDNPDDPKLTTLYCRLLTFAKRYHDEIAACELAVKTDTAFADTAYFQHQTTAYLADSQPQKAAETAAKGLAKFANNTTLLGLQAQALLRAGQTQQAVDAFKKLLAVNPKSTASWELLYTAYVTLQRPDSAIWALHGAVANGDETERGQAARYSLTLANAYFKRGNTSKSRDTLEMAIRYASYSDSLSTGPNPKFIMGFAQYIIGGMLEQDGAKAKNCDQVKSALVYWNTAEPNIHAGGSVSPPAAAEALQTITKYRPALESQIKVFCK
jgi:tetratricopeptide (TPR) repeat protein